jgi:hypothetical protein
MCGLCKTMTKVEHLFGLAQSILRTTFSLVTYYFILRDAEVFINFLVRTVTFCYDGYLRHQV